jgi:hypothetical protein
MVRRLTGGLVSCSGLKFKEEDLGRTFVATDFECDKSGVSASFTLTQCNKDGILVKTDQLSLKKTTSSLTIKGTTAQAKDNTQWLKTFVAHAKDKPDELVIDETKLWGKPMTEKCQSYAKLFWRSNVTGMSMHQIDIEGLDKMGIKAIGDQHLLHDKIQKLFAYTLEDEIQIAVSWLREKEGLRSTLDLRTAKPDFWKKAYLNISAPLATELQEKYAWSSENWLKFYKSEEKTDHVNVDMAVFVSDVSNILPDQGTFRCSLSLRLNWIEPTMKKTFLEKGTLLTKGLDVMDLMVGFENGINEELVSQTVKLLDPKKGIVQEETRYRATFSSLMTMLSFPFDKQALTIEISSQYGDLLHFSNSPWDYTDANILVQKNQEQVLHGLEWEVNVPSWTERYFWTGITAPWLKLPAGARAGVINFRKSQHAVDPKEKPFYEEEMTAETVRVRIQATRKPVFFVWGYFLLMGLITLMVFSVSAYNMDQYDERLSTVLSLQLTGIAFKLAADSTLPPVSSVTFVDAYMLLSIYFLSLFGFNVFGK